MHPLLAIGVTAPLAVSEAVQLELIKLVAIGISAVSSTAAVWLAQRSRKEQHEIHRKLNQKRAEVRKEDGDGVEIVRQPANPKDPQPGEACE